MSYNRNTKMYEGFIYEIFNDVNDVKYIGQTIRNINDRFREHKNDSIKKTQYCNLYKAINFIGVDHFCIKELKKIECKSKYELCNCLNYEEIKYISNYKSLGIKLYNMTVGGKDHQVNTYEEVPVIQYDLRCVEISRYDCISDASEITGIRHSDISECCNRKKIYRTQNYIWRRQDSPLTEEEILFYKNRYKGCKQYSLNGELLGVFYTTKDALKNLKLNYGIQNSSSGNISKCCLGKMKSAYGYVWRYFDDNFNKYSTPSIYLIEQRDIMDGNVISTYSSYHEIFDKYGYDLGTISNCCNKHIYSAYGYHWCFVGEYDECILKKIRQKSVFQFTKDGVFIAEHKNSDEAAKSIEATSKSAGSQILAVCNGIRKTAFGYYWTYSNKCF